LRDMEGLINALADVFNNLSIDYVIVGGVAVVSWGNLRTTRDVDIIISIGEKDVEDLVDALQGRDLAVSADDVRNSLEEKTHFTVFDKLSDFHADIKGTYTGHDESALRRRREVEIGDMTVYIASPEEIIAMKLFYGSEQDIKDAEGVYLRQKNRLDLPYLKKLCDELGVLSDFERIMDVSGDD
jgi:hypothetical protein